MSDNIILNKSKIFAIRIINLYKYLCDAKNEYVISKQLLRSGTSIGANIREAVVAQSKKDFISKMNIALKEASESEYWIELLFETDYISKNEFDSIKSDCSEINKLLISIVKTSNNCNL
ncbi:MAG: four helix bundle protein [Clostridia bacterium]|nr:four helix bundle protein [Clostridia bacterium]